jgi:predicted RNA-binding Zn ribbon-like protein
VTRIAGWGVIGVVALAVVWLASHREGDIARSIAEFLVTAEFKYLRRCANTDSCTLVFYDATKNHRRQWCSNSMCGNRYKVAEFRRRQRAGRRKQRV